MRIAAFRYQRDGGKMRPYDGTQSTTIVPTIDHTARSCEGSVLLSRCTAADPLHNIFTGIFGASISEAVMRPNP